MPAPVAGHDRNAVFMKRRPPHTPRGISSTKRLSTPDSQSTSFPAFRPPPMQAQPSGEPEFDLDTEATFLQYWYSTQSSLPSRVVSADVFSTICEQQMPAPNRDILYCSNECREKDHADSPNYPLFQTDIESVLEDPQDQTLCHDSLPFRNIIPQRTPTAVHYHNPFGSAWNKAISSQTTGPLFASEPLDSSANDSEAARYLRQVQTGMQTSPVSPRNPRDPGNDTPVPSLSLAAFSCAFSAPGSPTSTSSAFRPLQSRSNPLGSSTSFSSRSVDLVTPISRATLASPACQASACYFEPQDQYSHVSTGLKSPPVSGTTFAIAEEDMRLYEKKPAVGSFELRAGQGTLKRMFEFDRMRS